EARAAQTKRRRARRDVDHEAADGAGGSHAANDPLAASISDTAAVKRIATTGVPNRGLTFAKIRGTSPFSASANRLRDPESACPMLFPSVERTAPSVMSAAPPAPRKITDASASGV